MTVWWVSALIGVLFTDIPGRFVGPRGDLANAVGISLPLSPAVASVLHPALLRFFPKPRAVYGPEGPRPARTVDVPVPEITGPGTRPGKSAAALTVDGS